MGEVIRFPGSRRQPSEHEAAPGAVGHELLWREAVGHELRRERHAQRRTQSDVAAAAGISTQYLSEIERGHKEPSSEILHAALGALDLDLASMASRVAELTRSAPTGPVLLAA